MGSTDSMRARRALAQPRGLRLCLDLPSTLWPLRSPSRVRAYAPGAGQGIPLWRASVCRSCSGKTTRASRPASCRASPRLPLAPPLLQRCPRRCASTTPLWWALPPARRPPTSSAGEQAGRQAPGRPSCRLRRRPLKCLFAATDGGVESSVCRLARSDPGTAPPSAPAADAFAPCSSPAGLANLTDGNYLFAGALGARLPVGCSLLGHYFFWASHPSLAPPLICRLPASLRSVRCRQRGQCGGVSPRRIRDRCITSHLHIHRVSQQPAQQAALPRRNATHGICACPPAWQ